MTTINENQKTKEERKLYLKQLNGELSHCKADFIDNMSTEYLSKKPFIIQDIAGIIKALGDDPAVDMTDRGIIQVIINEGTDEEKLESIQRIVAANPHDIICADAYISEKEFPELSENPEIKTWADVSEDLRSRMEAALDRDTKIYEKTNFVNINDYVEYEYKVAMIYANAAGQAIINEINKDKEALQKKTGHIPPRPRYI